jgi:hypothetical protein
VLGRGRVTRGVKEPDTSNNQSVAWAYADGKWRTSFGTTTYATGTRNEPYTYPYTHGARSRGSSTLISNRPAAYATTSPVPMSPTVVMTMQPVQANTQRAAGAVAAPSSHERKQNLGGERGQRDRPPKR